MNGVGIWAGPFGELCSITSRDNPKRDAGGNVEELIVKLLVIWLEALLNI